MHFNNISAFLIAWKQTKITKCRTTKKQNHQLWTIDPLVNLKSLVTKSWWNHEVLNYDKHHFLGTWHNELKLLSSWITVVHVFITSWYCTSMAACIMKHASKVMFIEYSLQYLLLIIINNRAITGDNFPFTETLKSDIHVISLLK